MFQYGLPLQQPQHAPPPMTVNLQNRMSPHQGMVPQQVAYNPPGPPLPFPAPGYLHLQPPPMGQLARQASPNNRMEVDDQEDPNLRPPGNPNPNLPSQQQPQGYLNPNVS